MMGDTVAQVLEQASAAEANGRLAEAAALLSGLGDAIASRPAALHLAGVIAARQGDAARAAPLMERAARLGARMGLDTELMAVKPTMLQAGRRGR